MPISACPWEDSNLPQSLHSASRRQASTGNVKPLSGLDKIGQIDRKASSTYGQCQTLLSVNRADDETILPIDNTIDLEQNTLNVIS
jgi:hypothetical protein